MATEQPDIATRPAETDHRADHDARDARDALDYTALIRVGRYDALLASVVDALRAQTVPPAEILFVDSSRDPRCTAELARLGRVVAYPDEPFNYAKAVNVGIAAATGAQCLIISSHTLMADPQMIEASWIEARARGADVLYWAFFPEGKSGPPEYQIVDRRRFNGRNGLHNSAGMVPTALARARPFREDVFAAEDQEWAAHYLRTPSNRVLRTTHAGFVYAHPKYTGPIRDMAKYRNEEVAIAYYVHRRLLLPDAILARLFRAALAGIRGRPARARIHLRIAWDVLKANVRQPVAETTEMMAPAFGKRAAQAASDSGA